MDEVQLTPREHAIIEQLESVWQLPREISTETLKNITEMLLRLPEPHKSIGLQKIAEYTMGVMNLHVLSLLDLFQRKASAEDISPQEQNETLAQVKPDLFYMLAQMNTNHLSISLLDDLATFSNVVLSLHTLSQSESAEEAQSWLYELPATYQQQLHQEHLLAEPPRIVFTNATSLTRRSDHISYPEAATDYRPAMLQGSTIYPFASRPNQVSRSYIV